MWWLAIGQLCLPLLLLFPGPGFSLDMAQQGNNYFGAVWKRVFFFKDRKKEKSGKGYPQDEIINNSSSEITLEQGPAVTHRPSPAHYLLFHQLYWDILLHHEVHSLKLYNSIVFSMFTELYGYYHNLKFECCHHIKRSLVPVSSNFLSPLLPAPGNH